MSTTSIGREAEEAVASELQKRGHTIVALNWRTRRCEIDIVSKDKKCVYSTEVKYRSSDSWGSGFDYINDKKLKQMRFAAEFWLSENTWTRESSLLAAEVDDDLSLDIREITA